MGIVGKEQKAEALKLETSSHCLEQEKDNIAHLTCLYPEWRWRIGALAYPQAAERKDSLTSNSTTQSDKSSATASKGKIIQNMET